MQKVTHANEQVEVLQPFVDLLLHKNEANGWLVRMLGTEDVEDRGPSNDSSQRVLAGAIVKILGEQLTERAWTPIRR